MHGATVLFHDAVMRRTPLHAAGEKMLTTLAHTPFNCQTGQTRISVSVLVERSGPENLDNTILLI